MEMNIQVGTPLTNDNAYHVGDPIFVHHRLNEKVVTTIGFLVYMANRENIILARTIDPLSDFITITDEQFIQLGHIEYLKKSY